MATSKRRSAPTATPTWGPGWTRVLIVATLAVAVGATVVLVRRHLGDGPAAHPVAGAPRPAGGPGTPAVDRSTGDGAPRPAEAQPTVPAVAAAAAVSSHSYTGRCAPYHTLTFHGTVTVHSGPVMVTYRWVHSDGTTSPIHTIRFAGPGVQRQRLTTTWKLNASAMGWAAIEILDPAPAVSGHATFTLTCTH